MANKKSFWEMHEAVGGSYSTPERVQQEQERNQKRQEKTAEIYRQALENSAKRTEERRAAKQEQADQQDTEREQSQKATTPSKSTSTAVKDMNQLLTAAIAIKKGQDPIFAKTNAAVQREKDEKTSQNSVLEQTIKALQKQKKPGGMGTYQGTTDYNAGIQQQIDKLQNQIDTSKQEAADLNDYLIAALPEEDRKALEDYVTYRQTDDVQSAFGNVLTMFLYQNKTKSEREAAERLKEKYGEDTVKMLAETLERAKNAQDVQQMRESGAQFGNEHPVIGSIASVPVNVASGATSVFGRIHELLNRTGQYPTLDPNNPTNFGEYGSAIQAQVASDIEGEDPNFLRKAGSYAYRGGMSALESGLRAATGKAGTVLLSGLGSFEQNVAKASAQGATPEKAFTLGLTNAAIEALSEEIPLDNLLNAAKGGKQSFTKALGLALAQAGVEASTEEVSLIGTTLAEAAILKDKSEFNQYIQSRMAEGADYQTAYNEAMQDIIDEAIDTAIVSGISGAGMSGVNSIATNYKVNKAAKKQGSSQPVANAQPDTNGETDSDAQQAPQQVTEAPLQGEPADPRQLARQQAEAREAAQTMEQAQQTQPARQESPQTPTATDPLLEGIQTPVTSAQDQAPQQATTGRELLDGAIAETLGQNLDQSIDTAPSGKYNGRVAQEDVSTVINTNPETHTAKEQAVIDAYQAAVDENLVEYIEAVQNNQGGKMPKYPLSNVSERAASDIKQLTGVDVAGDKVQIESRIIEHILKDHGENGISDHSMRDINDIARIQYVIDNYDSIEHGGTSSAYVYQNQNGRNAQAQTVVMKKKVNGTYFVVEAVPDTKKKTVYITSAYMSKDGTQKAAGSLSGDANAPRVTSQNATKNPTASDSSIPASDGNVNGNVSTLGAQSDPYAPGIESVGAAPRDFTGKTGYYDLLPDENSQPDRATDVRPMELPKTDIYGDTISAVTGNVYGSDITSDEMASLMKEPVARGDFSYEEITNEKAKQMAAEKLRSAGNWDSALEMWTRTVANGRTGAEIAARGALLLKHFSEAGDSKNWLKTLKYMQKLSTNTAQGLQALRIVRDANDIVVSMDPISTAETAVARIQDMEQGDTTFNQKKYSGSFEDWKDSISENITNIAFEIDSVQDGDTAAMREIIRKIAKQRKTTAWFGTKDRLSASANANLNTLKFSDLKVVADTQLLTMTDDFRRRGVGEVLNGVRKTSMLSAITTFKRNLQGNTAVGLLDSFGDSTTGAIMDRLLSKITGKRTTSNDFFRPISYLKAAKNSGSFASLCVELNIPIETDAESSYASAYGEDTGGKYVAKTFRSTGNIGMRAMYAYQKYQSYALEVSDKIFEGGTKGAVDASLEKLNGLNADERQRLADYTANRRTFKDATWEGPDGRTHGSTLSRAAQYVKKGAGNLGENLAGDAGRAVGEAAADYVAPFVQVPTNVAQTGIDYSTGVFKGAGEMVSLIVDAKKGVDIPVERQRQAVSDFGRGMTGLALISLATVAAHYGIIRVGDDDDKDVDALHQSEGRNGAQINWSAWKRSMSGESAQWQAGDVISSLDSIEPFNTHMYLGVELAQEDEFLDMVKAYPKATFESSFNAFMDSPMVSGLQEMGEAITELVRSDDKAETLTENLAEATGSYVSSYIPQFVRQTAQYTDGYYRDTRGNNKLEAAVNQVKASIPGLSQTLPVKVNGLGEPQKRPGFTQTFLDPTKTTQYQPNEVTVALDALADQTGDKSIYPDYQAPMKITLGGEEISLDGTARTTYQMTYGNSVDTMYRGLLSSPGFSSLPQDAQTEALNKAERYATELAKASVAYNPDAPVESLEELVPKILSDTVTKQFTDALKDISNDQKYGRDTAGSIASLENAYNVYSTLPDDLREGVNKDSGGKVSDYMAAKESGMSANDFAKMYMVKSSFDDAFDSLTHAWEYDKDPASAVSTLEDAYSVYSGMDKESQKEFKENTGGKVGYFLDAKEAGVSTERFADLYSTYRSLDNNEGLTIKEKAQQWSYTLSKAQKSGKLTASQANTLKDSMVFRYSNVATTEKFDNLVESGMSTDSANSLMYLMEGIQGTGKNGNVRDIDKYSAIAGSSLSAKDKETALYEYMPDVMDEKYTYAKRNMGLTVDDFVKAYKVTDKYSLKEDQKKAWRAMGYTAAEAENLWKLYKGKLT